MKEFTAKSRVAAHAVLGLALAVAPGVAMAAEPPPPLADAGYQFTVAKLLAQEGSAAEALAAFAAAERLAPNDPYVHAEYGEQLLRLAQNVKSGSEQTDLLRRAGEQASRAQQLAPENAETLRTVGGIYLALSGQDAGAFAKAQAALEAAHRRDPRDPQTALTLGRLYLDRQQPEKASDVFRELVARAPQQRMAYALLVESLLRADKTKEAETALRELLALDPSSLEARVTLAELEGQRGDQAAAIATLQAAPENLRAEPRVIRQLALSRYLKGDIDASLATLEPLLKASPDDPQVAQLQALIFTALGRNQEAAQLLEKLRKERPDDPALSVTLARVLDRQGKRDRAAEVLTELADSLSRAGKTDASRQARLALAQMYVTAKDWDRAWSALGPLAGVGVDDSSGLEALMLSVDVLVERKRFDQALDLLDRKGRASRRSTSPDATPRGPAPIFVAKRAEVLFKAGRDREGRAALSGLVATGDPQALLAAAQTYQRANLYPESLPILKQLTAKKPDLPVASFLLATALERTGDREGAVAELRRLIGVAPEFHAALNYLGYMFAERKENLQEALTLVERAVALDPDNGAYVDSLGWIYYQLGSFEQARSALERATHLETGDATVEEHLGDVYGAMGEKERAREAYRRALDLPASDPAKTEQVRHKLDSLKDGAIPR